VLLLKWILWPLAGLYGLITTIRNLCYDCGIFKSEMLRFRLFCRKYYGGRHRKTPFVIALAEYLTQNGYRRRSLPWLPAPVEGTGDSCGRPYILATPQQAGDEAYLMARQLPDTVIISDADRTAAVRTALKKFNCNVILADDAFQHRRLGRCLDIVLWDAHTVPQNDSSCQWAG
jgi:tetraacyldisaccharide 4'-kinase